MLNSIQLQGEGIELRVVGPDIPNLTITAEPGETVGIVLERNGVDTATLTLRQDGQVISPDTPASPGVIMATRTEKSG